LEPFIEPWSLKVTTVQRFEKSIPEYKIWSNDFLDINLTYGMAVTIREIKSRILEKTLIMEEQMKKESMLDGSKFDSMVEVPELGVEKLGTTL
jgi:hypothetical protein